MTVEISLISGSTSARQNPA